MIGNILYPLSRALTAAIVFFTGILSGAGLSAALGTAPPSLQPPDWPVWAHEHWVWENEGTQESIMEMVEDYRALGIPVGAIIIDRPWSTGVNNFIPDPQRYPDLAEYIGRFHDMDVRVMLWATSVINEEDSNFREAYDNGYFLNGGKTVSWWAGRGAFIDYDNPGAVAWWHGQMDKALDMGIDGWKVDGADIHMLKLLPPWNQKGLVTWTRYKQQCYGDFFYYTREKLGKDRVISARPANDMLDIGLQLQFTGRDINFAGWVGDQDHSWQGLRAALDSPFFASLHNHVSSGSDIGGFRSGRTGEYDPPKDVFLRWAQLGAFCPVMENGGGGEHRPWVLDESGEATAIYKKFALLHHALIPYIYSQAAYSYERRLPTMRPVTGYYQYTLGDDILVAPIVNEGSERTIIFPAGEWIYMFDESQIYSGVKKLTFPLDEFPVFIRKGAIIPTEADGLTTVNIYPENGAKRFGLYEENKPGAMLSYTMDSNGLTFQCTPTDRQLLLCVHGEDGVKEIAIEDAVSGAEIKIQY